MLPSLQPNASKRAYVDQKATPFLISARYVTRQSDRERRTMFLGRRHVDPPPVCSHDPVDDVEPKSQVTSVARAASTALHRLKDATHEFVRNGRTVVVHRDDYLVCLPARRNPNRRGIRTVLCRVPYEIGHGLRQPGTVPYTVQFTARFDLQLAVRIRSGGRGDHSVEHSRHGHLRTRDRDRVAEAAASYPDCKLEVEASGELHGVWDCARLTQAMTNLIGNAAQHGSDATPIRVTARGEAHEVIIAVHNDGPAIPDELVGRIFQPMQRSRSSPGNRRHLGLGLYIVDRIVAAHRGRIDVASSEEHGTTFTVRLPRHVSS